MNDELLRKKLEEYKHKSFSGLKTLADSDSSYIDSYSVADIDGKTYQIEINIFRDPADKDDIRVEGSIYPDTPKRWWQRFISVSAENSGFIMNPNGQIEDLVQGLKARK